VIMMGLSRLDTPDLHTYEEEKLHYVSAHSS